MMKRASKWISLTIVLLLVMSLFAGCAPSGTTPSGQEPDNSGTPDNSGGQQAEDKALEDYTEPLKLVAFQAIGTASPADPVNNKYVTYIKEKFNIDMSETQFPTSPEWAKVQETLGLMISSGEMPDVVTMWVDANTLKMAKQFIDAGMCLDVTSYLEDGKMPNLEQDLTPTILDNYRSKDGKLYMIPSFTINPDNKETQYTMEPNLTFVKRADLFEKLGIEDPKTPEDFYQACLKLKEQPDVNGKPFIPFQTLSGIGDLEQMVGGMFGIWTHRGEMNEAEERFTLQYEFPEYLDFLKFASKLYREGLTDPEMFINQYDTAYAKAKEGRVGIHVEWPNDMDQLTPALRQVVPDGDYQPFAIPKVEGLENTQYWQTATLGTMITLVNKNVSDPDRIMKFIDWNVSTEGWMAQCYGGPGVDANDGVWHIEGDKYFYNTEFMDKKVQEDPMYMGQVCGGWIYFLAGRLVYHIDHQGFSNITESPDPQRMLARELNLPEVFTDPEYERITAIPAGPVELAKFTAFNKVVQDGVQKIVTTSKSDAEVETMYNEMMQNADKAGYTDIMKERYQRYLLWKDGKLEE